MKRIEYWYDFASTYSYLSAVRIEGLAAEAGVEVVWRPFLLGPIFKAQGWETSPFNIYPAKGRYMVRDIARIALARGIPFVMPEVFPANSLAAARLALVDAGPDWTRRFSRAVFEAQFARGDDISKPDLLGRVTSALLLSDSVRVVERSRGEEVRHRLRQQTQRAMDLEIFGAPSFVAADGELFWGDDRLADAILWAQQL